MEKHCETDCREDLICKINKAVQKTSVRWFVGVAVVVAAAVWGGSYGIYAGGVKKREIAIEKNQSAVSEIREQAAGMKSDLEHIKRTNERIETQNSIIIFDLKVLINKVRENGRLNK